MDDGAIKTLFLPFATGDLATGGDGARWLFLNASLPPQDSDLAKAQITAVQHMRQEFKALQGAGIAVTSTLPDGIFDGALILISRHRGLSRVWINQALDRVAPGGTIIFAGSKNDGVASVAKEVGGQFELLGNLSKHHAKAYWLQNTGSARFEEVASALIDNRYEAAPGMFSSDHVDPGSAFLMEHVPRDMKGRIADFCAGWGYLSAEVAVACPAVRSISLYEADYVALEAAKANMARLAPEMATTFHWQDLIGEKASGDYDTIIMNPPFHQGRAADPAIGNAIIRNAHNALHKGGKLYLVANRNLPYEATLAAGFYKSGELARNAYYKVLWATK